MGRRRKSIFKLKLKKDTVHSIAGILLITVGALLVISFAGKGSVLANLNTTLAKTFGLAVFFLPFIAIASGLMFFRSKQEWTKPHVLLGALLLMIGTLGLFKTGSMGEALSNNLAVLLTRSGVVVLSLAIFLIGVVVSTQTTLNQVMGWFAPLLKPFSRLKKDTGKVKESDEEKVKGWHLPSLHLKKKSVAGTAESSFTINSGDQGDGPPTESASTGKKGSGTAQAPVPPLMPHLSLDAQGDVLTTGTLTPAPIAQVWAAPPLELLDQSDGGVADRGDVKENAQMIESTLESFGLRATIKQVNFGPSVTQYALEPAKGTKLSKITGLSTDLALALAAPTGQVRIEAPIPGQALVGIEVPNRAAQYVSLRKMMTTPEMIDHPSKLAVALGIDVSSQPIILDIAKMPHVLIAGATGSGKSVAINSFLCSILFRASPQEVKMILIDPKRVELTGYNDVPHLLTPVIVESRKAGAALKWAVHEMEDRYKLLEEAGVRNIQGYNEVAGFASMPSIVIVVDELADVMLDAPADVEESITRIAQKARAVGIHLILATQRPSVDVLTGLIKANIPARIAFNVSSMMDSRVILDTPGAEKLLGKGDMLFIPPDRAKPLRIQGTFVSDKENKQLIAFIKNQGLEPSYIEEITSKYKITAGTKGGVSSTGEGGSDHDEMYLEVAKFLVTQDRASSSMIQRRFRLGYNRAANIIDQMYSEGLVGPPDGSKSRSVNNAKLMGVVREGVGTGEEMSDE